MIVIRSIFSISLLCLVATFALCQESVERTKMDTNDYRFNHKNSIQFELFGIGGWSSLNYERVIINKNNVKTLARIGGSYANMWTRNWVIGHISFSELFSFNKHHIEVGAGYSGRYYYVDNSDYHTWSNIAAAQLGYRFQKPNGRLILKASSMFVFDPRVGGFPWGNAGIGFAF